MATEIQAKSVPIATSGTSGKLTVPGPRPMPVIGAIGNVMQFLPDLYPDPERFYPDRWLTIDPSPFEYQPFGAGPRMCIGAPFAIMSIKIVLAIMLQRYRLQFIPGTQVDRKWAITMSPKQGLPMLDQTQDWQFTRGVGGVRGNLREMVKLPE